MTLAAGPGMLVVDSLHAAEHLRQPSHKFVAPDVFCWLIALCVAHS